MKSIVALSFVVSLSASAQCFGPGGCPTENGWPDRICIGSVCTPVDYQILDRFVIARATLPAIGYPQIGWSGPCPVADVLQCPGAFEQAAQDLEINLLRINRALKQ